MILRLPLFLLSLSLSFSCIAGFEQLDIANGNSKLKAILITFAAQGAFEALQNNNTEAGKFICVESGGSGCNYVSTVGEGICRGGNGSGCTYVTSIGEGICRAGGGSGCTYVTSVGEGFCRAGSGSGCTYTTSIGEGICRAGGGSGCTYVSSVGEGICRAGGGSGCTYVTSAGEGICRAGGGSGCNYVRTVEEGLLKVEQNLLSTVDVEWDWDQFYDQYGSLQWRCRGVQTGQFATDSSCFGKFKTDNRWPAK